MTKQRHAILLDQLNDIRRGIQTQHLAACSGAVCDLCEIVGELLCELRNVEGMATRAGHTASEVARFVNLPEG